MPAFASSPSPVMTSYPTNAHAGSSSAAGPSRHRTVNAGQSLADLYNTRHAQESSGPSTAAASSSSLTDLYNQAYKKEKRKAKPSSHIAG